MVISGKVIGVLEGSGGVAGDICRRDDQHVANNVGRVLVMRGDHMLGMVTRTGLLRFLETEKTLTRQEKEEGR